MGRKIYLLRHAEPYEPDGAHRCLGLADVPLTKRGREQADKIKSWLRQKRIGAVYSSPLKRCMQTAEIVVENPEQIKVCQALHEMDAGKWENLTFGEIRERYPEEYEERGKQVGYYAPPGGESFYQAGLRFQKALDAIREQTTEDLLVIAHAGVIRGYLCILKEISVNEVLTLPQPYVGISILEEQDDRVTIERIGYRPTEFLDDREIERLYHKCGTPAPVICHMRAVEVFLAGLLETLDPDGRRYNHELLKKAALVHDIARTEKDHPAVGAGKLRQEGYEEIAKLVEEHHSEEQSCLETLSMSELLFYADKRVRGDCVVSVEERFEKSREKCKTEVARVHHSRLYEKTKTIELKIENQYKNRKSG